MTNKTLGEELLMDLKLQITKHLLKRGFDDVSAIHIGEKAAFDFQKQFGGQWLYIARDKGLDAVARKSRIIGMHKEGNTIADIIRATRMSSSRVYQIVKEARYQSGKELEAPTWRDGKSGKLLKEMHFCLTRCLAKNGIAKNEAYTIGEETTMFIRERWGGIIWSLPRVKTSSQK